MIFVSGSSLLGKRELENRAREEGILLINPKKINSEEELLLAELLAKNAMAQKRSIAKKEEVEFLLWLAAKTNIKSAQKEYGFSKPGELLLISLQKGKTRQKLLSTFKMKESRQISRKRATAGEIERISLSRL
jgi:tRNA threonylcarbamoyladenosine modification (KEOPS) complex Cgi121 subunit